MTRYPDIIPWAFGILSVASVVGALAGTYHLWLASRSRRWPMQKGQIIRSELEESRNGDTVTYTPRILYGYVVDGRTYTGTMVEFGDGSFENEASRRKKVARYKANQPVTVFYDPSAPSIAVLKRGHRTGLVWATIVSYLIMIASGLILWKVGIKTIMRL